jgi:hypothetical protein
MLYFVLIAEINQVLRIQREISILALKTGAPIANKQVKEKHLCKSREAY